MGDLGKQEFSMSIFTSHRKLLTNNKLVSFATFYFNAVQHVVRVSIKRPIEYVSKTHLTLISVPESASYDILFQYSTGEGELLCEDISG